MSRDHFENGELDDFLPPWLRGEMAVVADPDACDEDLDDEMPDTVPETRPLGARVERPDGVDRERAGGEETAPPSI